MKGLGDQGELENYFELVALIDNLCRSYPASSLSMERAWV